MSSHRRRQPGYRLSGRRGRREGRQVHAVRYGGKARGHSILVTVAAALTVVGGTVLGIAVASQQHAPQPTVAQAGTIGPVPRSPQSEQEARGAGHAAATSSPTAAPAAQRPGGLARSAPISITIPAIGVRSRLLTVGLNADGTIQVPPLFATPSEAAWFNGSPTPGQVGSAVIEGHVDTYKGPSVFFRLGALRPGDTVDVTLADRTVAVFRVTGVRQYAKDSFPTLTVYGDTSYPSLRLITCGGTFDSGTGHYLSSTVVFTSLIGSRLAGVPR